VRAQRAERFEELIHELLVELRGKGIQFRQVGGGQMTRVLEQEWQFVIEMLRAFGFLCNDLQEVIVTFG